MRSVLDCEMDYIEYIASTLQHVCIVDLVLEVQCIMIVSAVHEVQLNSL